MITIIVFYQRIFLAIQREFSPTDAVAITADKRAEKRIIFFIGSEGIITKNHIDRIAAFIRHQQ
jgi:hypothetical protein